MFAVFMPRSLHVKAMQRVRTRHPAHIPCLFKLPDQTCLKLLLPKDASVAHAMLAVRQRMRVSDATAVFSFVQNKMCTGSTRVQSLDLYAPEPVVFTIRHENTFGAAMHILGFKKTYK